MDPLDYLRALRQRWALVLSCVVIALIAGWLTTPDNPNVVARRSTSYTATATLLRDPTSQQSLGYVALFITRGDVPGIVAKQLNYAGHPAILASTIDVKPDSEVGTITISSSGPDGPEVAKVANTFATAIIAYLEQRTQDDKKARIALLEQNINTTTKEIKTLQKKLKNAPDTDVALRAQRDALAQRYGLLYSQLQTEFAAISSGAGLGILQEATPIASTNSPAFAAPSTRGGRLKIALLAGLLLGAALALVIDRFDTRLRRRDEVQEAYGLPVIAEVPKIDRGDRKSDPVFMHTRPSGAPADAFRALRSSLMLLPSSPLGVAERAAGGIGHRGISEKPPKVVLVVSARPAEGKTTTAVNLAAALAESGKRVLVLDCDFRGPTAHKPLDVPWGPGVSDLWDADAKELMTLSRPTAVPGIRLVTAGTALDRPPALPLKMAELLNEARSLCDAVIIDAAPLLAANDAIDLMPYVDSVLVVCRSGRTTKEQARRSVELLHRMRVPVAGVILNAVPHPSSNTWDKLVRRYGSASRAGGRHQAGVSEGVRGRERPHA